jgi:hypothetical protein
MEIYHYHPVSGEFVGAGQADPDPLDKGNLLIPANATDTAAPAEQAGKARVWNGSAWVHVLDHRGETWWDADGEAVQIQELGDPADQGLTSVEPPAPPPTKADVDAEATRRVAAGFVFNGTHYQSDALAQKRITGAAALAHQAITVNGKAPTDTKWHGGSTDFAWIATDNSLVGMDAQTVLAFGAAAANWESVHVFAAKALKDTDPIPADYVDDKYWP